MRTNKPPYNTSTILCYLLAGMAVASPAFADGGKSLFPVDESSASSRAVASATIIQSAIASCDRALKSLSVNTYNLGGGDSRPHGPMIFRCERKGGRLNMEFIVGDNNEATGVTDAQLRPGSGPRTADHGPKEEHGTQYQVIEFNYNYE